MGVAQRITDPMFNAAVGALNTVGMVWHGFTRSFVDQFYLVAEVYWHWQQAAEGCRYEGVTDNDSACACRHRIAMGTDAVDGGGIEAIDKYG